MGKTSARPRRTKTEAETRLEILAQLARCKTSAEMMHMAIGRVYGIMRNAASDDTETGPAYRRKLVLSHRAHIHECYMAFVDAVNAMAGADT